MVKIDTQFMTKTAEKPYRTYLCSPYKVILPPRAVLWLLNQKHTILFVDVFDFDTRLRSFFASNTPGPREKEY